MGRGPQQGSALNTLSGSAPRQRSQAGQRSSKAEGQTLLRGLITEQEIAALPQGCLEALEQSASPELFISALAHTLDSLDSPSLADAYARASSLPGPTADPLIRNFLRTSAEGQPPGLASFLQSAANEQRPELALDPETVSLAMGAIAALGKGRPEAEAQWNETKQQVVSQLRVRGLQAEADHLANQHLVDLSTREARQSYNSFVLPGDKLEEVPASRGIGGWAPSTGPLVILERPDFVGERMHWFSAHELAHKIAHFHTPQPSDMGGFLIAECFNELRTVQLIGQLQNSAPWHRSKDIPLRVAYGLAKIADCSPEDCLHLSDSEIEQRLAAGLGMSKAQLHEQVIQPFEDNLQRLQQATTSITDSELLDSFTQGLPDYLRQGIRSRGHGYRVLRPIDC